MLEGLKVQGALIRLLRFTMYYHVFPTAAKACPSDSKTRFSESQSLGRSFRRHASVGSLDLCGLAFVPSCSSKCLYPMNEDREESSKSPCECFRWTRKGFRRLTLTFMAPNANQTFCVCYQTVHSGTISFWSASQTRRAHQKAPAFPVSASHPKLCPDEYTQLAMLCAVGKPPLQDHHEEVEPEGGGLRPVAEVW